MELKTLLIIVWFLNGQYEKTVAIPFVDPDCVAVMRGMDKQLTATPRPESGTAYTLYCHELRAPGPEASL